MAPATPIKVVAGSAAIRRDRDSVDRADLGSLWVYHVEKRQNVLFEGIRDISAGKPGSFDRIEKLRQPSLPQTIDVHQMIETIDSRGRESIGKERRRQRAHDVGPYETDQHPSFTHAVASAGARPPPRKSCAMRGSDKMFCAISSILVCPCSRTIP